MEMHQVRYFLALAQELNFTKAAELCNVSQPSLTRAIRSLEDNLGGKLINRERAQTHLTELGRMLLPYMQNIWSQADELKRVAQQMRAMDRSVLKLGLMCTIAPNGFLELVRNVRMNHPGVELQASDATASELVDSLESGALDVAILAHPDQLTKRHHCLPLYRERFVIAVAADHALAPNEFIRVRDLNGADYIDRTNCEYGDHALEIFAAQNIVDRTVFKSDRDDWVLAMTAAGMGYAFMPQQSAVHPGIVARPLIEPEIWREVCLVTVRGRPYPPSVGALVKETLSLFPQRPKRPDENDEAAPES